MLRWIRELRRLRAENTEMRRALLWYATEENWRCRATHPKGAPKKHWKKSPAAFDRGALACRVLGAADNTPEQQRELEAVSTGQPFIPQPAPMGHR